ALAKEILKLRSTTNGPEHPDTLEAMQSLARAYSSAGRYEEALAEDQETLKLRTAIYPTDHPNVRYSLNAVANDLMRLQRFADGPAPYEEVLRRYATTSMPDDSPLDKPNIILNLANAYRCCGRFADAIKVNNEALMLVKARCGPDHPDTLDTMAH